MRKPPDETKNFDLAAEQMNADRGPICYEEVEETPQEIKDAEEIEQAEAEWEEKQNG